MANPYTMLTKKKEVFVPHRVNRIRKIIAVVAIIILIFGIIWIITLLKQPKYNVGTINENARAEINKLFVEEEQRSAVYLFNQTAKVKRGKYFGIAFAIKNVGDQGVFSYDVKLISKDCLKDDPLKWFELSPSGTGIQITSGGIYHDILRLKPATTAELCRARFIIEIKKENAIYDTPIFIVETQGKGII